MLGYKSPKAEYFLKGVNLDQRDLGVLLYGIQKVNMQVQKAIRKANSTLAFIARGLKYKEILL